MPTPAPPAAPPAAVPVHALDRTLLALACAGAVSGLIFLAAVASSSHVEDRGAVAALGLLVGWSFIGTGLLAWRRRPENRTGALMAAVGFAWFATGVSASDDDLAFTVGIALDALAPALAVHLLLAFPTGRLASRGERLVIGAIYVVVTVLQVPSLLFEERTPGEPRNLLVVDADQELSDLLDALQFAVAVGVLCAAAALLWRRWTGASPPHRRAIAPVLWTGAVALVTFGVANGFDAAGAPSQGLEWLAQATLAAVPFGFLAGLLRSRLAGAGAMSGLLSRLGRGADAESLRAGLADALGDPSLALAYWLPVPGRFVDADGREVSLAGEAWTEVELRGARIAAIRHDPALLDDPELVRAAGAAAALAIENQRLSAELRARIEDLRASRARFVEAADGERRRLERDLHDGAQSRLVALAIRLQLARRRAEPGSEVAALLEESSKELQASLDELRELARGIHPAVLTDRGLGPALEALAARSPVPVRIAEGVPDDLPPAVATAVYFVVSEALTNVAKYARATAAAVTVARGDGAVAVEVADDGVGGADTAAGSGLRGLADRVGALDGRLEVRSPPGAGTSVRALIPLAS